MEDACLLSSSLWLVQLAYTTQDTCLGIVPTTIGWVLPKKSLIKRIPYRLEVFSQLRFLFFR